MNYLNLKNWKKNFFFFKKIPEPPKKPWAFFHQNQSVIQKSHRTKKLAINE